MGCAGWGGGWGGVIVGGGSVGGGSVGGGWLLFYPLREKLETLKKYLLSYYLSTYLSLHESGGIIALKMNQTVFAQELV